MCLDPEYPHNFAQAIVNKGLILLPPELTI